MSDMRDLTHVLVKARDELNHKGYDFEEVGGAILFPVIGQSGGLTTSLMMMIKHLNDKSAPPYARISLMFNQNSSVESVYRAILSVELPHP